MRLIDANALKRAINKDKALRQYLDCGHAKSWLMQTIDEQPTVRPEGRWIPCSERLPEESGEYFVTLKRVVLPINLFYPEENTYEYVTRIDRFNGEKFDMPTVVAWWSERLPKPWEGDT